MTSNPNLSNRLHSFSARAAFSREEKETRKNIRFQAVELWQTLASKTASQKSAQIFQQISERVGAGDSLKTAFASLSPAQRGAVSEGVSQENLEKLFSLSDNVLRENFLQEALDFGVGLKMDQDWEAASSVLGYLCQKEMPDELHERASRELGAILGQGSVGLRCEVLIGRFGEQSTDYKTILPMLAAGAVGSIFEAKLATSLLQRPSGWITRGWGAKIFSTIGGFVPEFTSFALMNRALEKKSDSSLLQDLGRSALSLGSLKLFSALGHRAVQGLSSTTLTGGAIQNLSQKIPQVLIPQVSVFLGMFASHKIEEGLKLRDHLDGATTSTDILASMVSLGAGGYLGRTVMGKAWQDYQAELGLRLKFSEENPGRSHEAQTFKEAEERERDSKTNTAAPLPSRRSLSWWNQVLLSPMWMMLGTGTLGGGGFSPKSELALGEALVAANKKGELPSVDAMRWLRRKTLEVARQEYQGSEDLKTYLERLQGIHRLLEASQEASQTSSHQNAWDQLLSTVRELGIDLATGALPQNEGAVSKPSVPIPSAPAKSFQKEVKFKTASGGDRQFTKAEILEKQFRNVKVINRLRQALEARFQEIELCLRPQVQEKYLDGMRKAGLLADISEQEAKVLEKRISTTSAEDITSVSRKQAQAFQELKAMQASLEGETLSEIVNGSYSADFDLRDYQEKMLAGIKADLESGNHPWLGLASPMQTGKSFLIAPLIQMLRQHFGPNCRFIVLSSARVITGQLMDDLLEGFPKSRVGRFDGLVKEPKDITVASVGALVRNLDSFSREGPVVLINDEAYSTQTRTVGTIYNYFGFAFRHEHDSGKWEYRPRKGNGLVVGLSGTGAGLKGYRVSGELNLLEAIQQKWIRHMIGEREFLQIESETPPEKNGENMVWWKPTLANARVLAEIYQDKIHKKYADSLVFVPTIRHADLLKEAFDERFGEKYAKVVHSGMKEEENDNQVEKAISEWERDKGALISVKKLSRGFRGTGVGAVFHTYQTSSMELYAQRTGRAWGLPEDAKLAPLFVLEATWNRTASFANLARLLGLADYSDERLFTEKVDFEAVAKKPAPKIEAETNDKVSRQSQDLFAEVPILEGWRTVFDTILHQGGGVHELIRKSGLSEEVLAGYALGALPLRLWDIFALKDYLGGKEKAREIWVSSWEKVVDEALAGKPELAGPGGEHLVDWRKNEGSLREKSRQLDAVLRDIFWPKKPVGKDRLVQEVRDWARGNISLKEAERFFGRAVKKFRPTIAKDQTEILEQLFLSPQSLSPEAYAAAMGSKLSVVKWHESRLVRDLSRALKKELEAYLKGKYGNIPIEKMELPAQSLSSLRNAGFRRFGEILTLSPGKLLEVAGVDYPMMLAIREAIDDGWGLSLAKIENFEEAKSIPLSKFSFPEREFSLLDSVGVKTIDQFLKLDLAGILKIQGLELAWVKGLQKEVREVFGLNAMREFLRQTSMRNMDWSGVPLTSIGIDKEIAEALGKYGIVDLALLQRFSRMELLAFPEINYDDLQAIQVQLKGLKLGLLREQGGSTFQMVPVEKMGFSPEIVEGFRRAGIRFFRDLELLRSSGEHARKAGFSPQQYAEIYRHMGTNLKISTSKNPLNVGGASLSIASLGFSPELTKILLDHGFRESSQINEMGPADWLAIPGINISHYKNEICFWVNPEKRYGSWEKVPIEKLDLPPGMTRDLKEARVFSVDQLLKLQRVELLALPHGDSKNVLALVNTLHTLRLLLPKGDENVLQDQRMIQIEKVGLTPEITATLRSAGVKSLKQLVNHNCLGLLRETSLTWEVVSEIKLAWHLNMDEPMRPLEAEDWDRFEFSPDKMPFSPETLAILRRAGIREVKELKTLSFLDLLEKDGVRLPDIWRLREDIYRVFKSDAGKEVIHRLPLFSVRFRLSPSLPLAKWAPNEKAYRIMRRDGIKTLGDLLKISNLEIARRKYFSVPDFKNLLDDLPDRPTK